MTLLVLDPGPLALVEDLGRPGFADIGVSGSGALDRGALTLANRLLGNDEGAAGLEVLSHDGEWVPFTSDADTIVVNIGDMLQRLTNHVYPSTTHRVVNPPGEQARQPRYSVPFFLHPNPDFVIDVLPSTISADNPSRYPEPITAQGYLDERLREIKLK